EPESRNVTNQIQTHLHDAPKIYGSASDLYDALVNLIFNAVDAMPQGGTLSLTTQIVDESTQIIVTDTGEGMDAETQQKVFEPFFTTKIDVGRGLGLSTVYNTITRWKGLVTVESTLGQGTTFTITLPLCTEEQEQETPSTPVSEGRRGRILIVDDEPDIAEILLTVFESEHDVEIADSGKKALEHCETKTYEIALLDLGMPGMSGDVLAEELKKINPNIALILTTGWKLPDDDPRLTEFDFWIQKPFRGFDRIRELVQQAIELHDQRIQNQ
ncbi:MAG: response regulator, partial [Candidatus Latescibacteria bacterium]|nr:response regulator [Candidatus Latescibacterota bacterium]